MRDGPGFCNTCGSPLAPERIEEFRRLYGFYTSRCPACVERHGEETRLAVTERRIKKPGSLKIQGMDVTARLERRRPPKRIEQWFCTACGQPIARDAEHVKPLVAGRQTPKLCAACFG